MIAHQFAQLIKRCCTFNFSERSTALVSGQKLHLLPQVFYFIRIANCKQQTINAIKIERVTKIDEGSENWYLLIEYELNLQESSMYRNEGLIVNTDRS